MSIVKRLGGSSGAKIRHLFELCMDFEEKVWKWRWFMACSSLPMNSSLFLPRIKRIGRMGPVCHKTLSVLSVKSVVKIRNHPLVYCSPGRIYSVLFCRLSYYCYLTAKLDYYESLHTFLEALRCLEDLSNNNLMVV